MVAIPQNDLSVMIVVSVYSHDDDSTLSTTYDDRSVKIALWNVPVILVS